MDTKKYIIEIPDNTAWLQWVNVSDKDGHVCFDFKDPEDLTPYTEPDTEQVREEAYEDGYKTAKVQCNIQAEKDLREVGKRHYQKGLSDAWETARKIAKLNTDEQKRLFGCFGIYFVAHEFSASEAIEKIRQYEEQEEIKVGNEVNGKGGRGVITKISDDGDHFNVMWENGSTGYYMIGDFKKTGRNFPEIVEVLREMQEEKE